MVPSRVFTFFVMLFKVQGFTSYHYHYIDIELSKIHTTYGNPIQLRNSSVRTEKPSPLAGHMPSWFRPHERMLMLFDLLYRSSLMVELLY